MRVLVTETTRDRFGEAVAAVAADIELVAMTADGSLRPEVSWADAGVEVIWATADLFAEGAPIRAFFAFVAGSTTVRWLQSPAAGVDDPLFATLLARGVAVTNAHVNSIPIVEYVLRAALDHAQQAQEWRHAEQERAWRRHDFTEMSATSWLVIGLGSIGTEVSSRARALGARVVGVRQHPSGNEPVDQMIAPGAIADILPSADVVVLCAPATPATHRLVDAAFLAAMKGGALLINVGRGSLVDEVALLGALDAGGLGGAVLDVFDVEPLPADHPFWDHPRVTVTAHNAAGGTGRYERAAELFIDNLRRYRAHQPLRNEVTRGPGS
ncbi:MAG: D-2-hydroxyacid dehydrogenase [Acidimicrobiales bacterium]